MRSHYRAITIAIALAATAAATTAFAQSSGTSQSVNPIARGDDVSFHSPFSRGQPSVFGRGGLDNTGIGRPNPRSHHQVTPVPEPSQWAMLAAGLALVGFIVRRNSRKSRDAS
jgi:hypothetical protein